MDIKNFWAISNLMPFQIYGAPTFKSLKDAKGKKFAISRFGSLSEFLTRSSLRQFSVDAKEVTLLQIGATPARFTALAGGMVDATVLWFPVTERAKAIEIGLPEAGVVAFQHGFEAWAEVVGAGGLEPSVAVHDGGSGSAA